MNKKKSDSQKNSSDKLGIKVIDTESLISIHQSSPPLLSSKNLITIGESTPEKLQILVSSEAFQKIDEHTQSDTSREVGGFLIGRPYEWKGKKYVEIVNSLAAEASSSSAVHLTISSENWMHAQTSLREKFPGMYIVGWYHTHPRMALFLSMQDLAIHEGFFRESWHVALVLDPTQHTASFFAWDKGKVREANGYRIAFPTELSVKEWWHVPDLYTSATTIDVALQDFYEIGCWHTRWLDEDKMIIKLQGDTIKKLGHKLENPKFPIKSIQTGFCLGKIIINQLNDMPNYLLDARILYPLMINRQADAVMFEETIREEMQKTMADSRYLVDGLRVMGLYIFSPSLPKTIKKMFTKSLPSQIKFIIFGNVFSGDFNCVWKNTDGKLVEREMIEMISLSELTGDGLDKTVAAVKETYRDIMP